MRAALRITAVAVLVAALAGCGTAGLEPVEPRPEPREGRAGLQLSGTVAGRQMAVSDGAPLLRERDCEAWLDLPALVCFASRAIDGTPVVLGIANPGAFLPGEPLPVADSDCRRAERCAQVRDTAVVDVALGDRRLRAHGGSVTMRTAEEGNRYAGSFTLLLPGGRLTGEFDVVPRADA